MRKLGGTVAEDEGKRGGWKEGGGERWQKTRVREAGVAGGGDFIVSGVRVEEGGICGGDFAIVVR